MSGRETERHTEWRIHSPLLASCLSQRGTESTRVEDAGIALPQLTASPLLRAARFKAPESLIFSVFAFKRIITHDGNTPLQVEHWEKLSAFMSSSICMSLNFFLFLSSAKNFRSWVYNGLSIQFTETSLRLSWAYVNSPLSVACLISRYFLNVFSSLSFFNAEIWVSLWSIYVLTQTLSSLLKMKYLKAAQPTNSIICFTSKVSLIIPLAERQGLLGKWDRNTVHVREDFKGEYELTAFPPPLLCLSKGGTNVSRRGRNYSLTDVFFQGQYDIKI